MPRLIHLVTLLSCVGCVGTGRTGVDSAGELRPPVSALPAPEESPSPTARTVSYRTNSDEAAEPTAATTLEALESGLLEDQPQELETLPAPDASAADVQMLQLNLPTVLSMIGPQHPSVGLAQWRVQEAYANLEQARALC